MRTNGPFAPRVYMLKKALAQIANAPGESWLLRSHRVPTFTPWDPTIEGCSLSRIFLF